MSHTSQHTSDAPHDSEEHQHKDPPAWQIAVPFFVTLFALIALVVFVYGFCAVRNR